MGFETVVVRFGRPAVEVLARQVEAVKGGDPLAPVIVVVPSNYAAVATRRALAARPGGVANVTCLTLHRLAERLGAPTLAAAGRRPVSPPVLAQALRAVLHDDPGIFAEVAGHPATELSLVEATRELAGVSPAALDAVAAQSPRAADVVRIARSVRHRLEAAWHDEHDLLLAAADVVRAGGPAGPVIVHLLQRLSPAGGAFLAALAERDDVRVNVGLTGEAGADRAVVEAHARAGVVVAAGDADGVEPAVANRIVTVSDPDEEVRHAVRLVVNLAREGVPLDRVALLYGATDPYARLLHEHLAAAGISHSGAPVRPIGALLLGRTLRSLLALPDRGLRRADVLAVLTSSPVRDGDRRVPSRAWVRISREAGVVGGDDWGPRLAAYAEQARRGAGEAERDGRTPLAAHRSREAERAEGLADFVAGLAAALDTGAAATSWTDLVAWAKRLLDRYLGDEDHRARWPSEEVEAARRVEEALDRLAGLDAVDGPAPTVEVFRRSLDGELAASLPRVGRFGDGVLVGPVSLAAGLTFDRLVVLGMAEGTFPPRRLEDSLLSDAERALAGGELALRSHRLHDDHRHLLAAVAAADESVLCFPRGDLRRSGERAASRWLLSDAAELAGLATMCTADLGTADRGNAGSVELGERPWLSRVASFAGGLRTVVFPASEQDLRLAAIARHAVADPRGHPTVLADGVLAAGVDLLAGRRSNRFTRFDGNLAGVADALGPPGPTSATRLQAWATCPHAYLLTYVLGVEPVEEPEHRFDIDPMVRGSLVHDILDRFVRGALDAGRRPDGWDDADRRRLRSIAEEVCAEAEALGVTGRSIYWRRDKARILADLDGFLARDGERLRAGIRPLDAEHRFRDLEVKLPSGLVLRVGGSIDRVDQVQADASLVVVDYKTGKADGYKGLEEDVHQRGTRLQLFLYAAAARDSYGDQPVWAGYWFATEVGKFKWQGYHVTPEVELTVGVAVDTIVAGIAAGVFPARPAEKARWKWVDCWYCSPDGGSTAELRRSWERKRLDPALAGYVSLCEPPPPPAPTPDAPTPDVNAPR